MDVSISVLMRDIEMKTIPEEDITIKEIIEPTAMVLRNGLTLKSFPGAVCLYKGCLYVGCEDGSIAKWETDGHVHYSFIKLDSWICGIVAHEEKLYSLMYKDGGSYKVYVHDLTGKKLFGWAHQEKGACSRRVLAVMGDQLLIAGRKAKKFSFYTLTGEHVRDVVFDAIKDDLLSLCFLDENSILVANQHSMYRLDINTPKIVWCSDNVKDPVGVCKLNDDFSIVTTNYSDVMAVWTLNHNTGERRFFLANLFQSYLIFELKMKGS